MQAAAFEPTVRLLVADELILARCGACDVLVKLGASSVRREHIEFA